MHLSNSGSVLAFFLATSLSSAIAQTPDLRGTAMLNCSGLPCVDVTLGSGKHLRMLIDTGNVNSLLDTAVANEAGLAISPAHGADGKQMCIRDSDLIGYYTRYGDVRELVNEIDDRYVIVNSGDELSLRFSEQPPPPVGWVRDFVIVGDGWIKDGDYNSTFSKTVLPLPYHACLLYTSRCV